MAISRPASRLLRFLWLVLLAAGPPAAARAQSPATGTETARTAPVWLPFAEAVTAADASGKMVLVDVWSATCGWCARMQREVYTRPELLSYLYEHFETGRLDIDVRTDTIAYMGYELSSAELSVAFGATGTPTAVFLTPDGTYITRLPGYHPFDRFLEVLQYIGSESFREMTFDEYAQRADGQGRD